MPRKIGKTPVQRIRFSRELFDKFKKDKKGTETWEEYLDNLYHIKKDYDKGI